jgi:hypothetical protein
MAGMCYSQHTKAALTARNWYLTIICKELRSFMPDPALPRELNQVLVAGTMNPSIHHPQLYHALGLIDAAELAASLKNEGNVTTPMVSRLQFGSPPLVVTCVSNQWSIQSTEEGSWTRMLRTASLIFAKNQEPTITAYGFVSFRHIDTEVDVKEVLAKSVAGLHLGFPIGKNTNTNITSAVAEQGYTISSSIQTSVFGDRVVFGLYHHDYPAKAIESILDGRFDRFTAESKIFFAHIVKAINEHAPKG